MMGAESSAPRTAAGPAGRSANSSTKLDATAAVREAALAAEAAGISVVRVRADGSKQPDGLWKHLQAERATPAIVASWYSPPREGVGILCGAVSGNLECLEFDCRDTYNAFLELARETGLESVIDQLETGYVEDTPGGGVHWLYRCKEIAGNTKLAQREKRLEEQKNPDDKFKTLIETRGEGGFLVVAPSHGRVHPSGRPYVLRAGGVATIPTIEPEAREALLSLARTFDQQRERQAEQAPPTMPRSPGAGDRPGDHFNRSATWEEILEPRGWKKVRTRSDGTTEWRRPGKGDGISATTGHTEADTLMVFSTSTPFEIVPASYSKFAAWTVLEHGSDFAAATRALADRSLGSQRVPASAEPWPEPLPLPPKTPAVPSLPEALLPDPLRPWLVDAGLRACLPLEYLAVPTLVGLSSLIGRYLAIYPKRHDLGFLVVPNIWGGIVGRPGLMKTAAVKEGLSPLQPMIARARAEYEENAASMEFEKVRLELEIKALMGPKNKVPCDPREIAALKRELRECVAVERRYLTHDSTVEKLGVILNENPRGVLVVRDELAGWLYTLEKPGHEGDRQFYLEAWNGTGSYTVDRIGRGTLHVPALCISIVGGIQPARLQPFLEEALDSRPGADGLIQRFQLIVWPDEAPAWRNHDRLPDARERERVQRVFEAIDSLDVKAIIGEPLGGTVGLDVIPAVHFAADAQDLFDTWRDDLERRLRSPELQTTPAFEGHLSKFRSLMPSLALIFSLVDAAEGGFVSLGGGVPLDAAQRAAAWCEYLEQHARKLYAVELNPAALAAHELARCIRERLLADGMTVRDIQRAEWRGLTREGAVRDAIGLLERVGWLRQERREPGAEGGRPPSVVIRLNPRLGEGRG